jgi:type IV pilus assembly protein PilM
MFNKREKKTDSIGLDIGSHSIKVVSLKQETDNKVLTSYNIKNIPPNLIKTAKMGKMIQETFSEIDMKPSEVNISISGTNVIVRFVSMPKMSEEQLSNVMSFEAERYIPFNVNDVFLDFKILDSNEEGQMNVLLAAAKKEFVNYWIELFEKLGIRIGAIDVDAFAVFNAFACSNKMTGNEGTMFLDCGHSETNILISTGEVPRFMRLIQIGGRDITAAIAEELKVSEEEAGALKMEYPEDKKENVRQATFLVLDELVKEIQLSLGYFENKYAMGVGNVYASGGTVYQEGVLDYLKYKMEIPFELWNPFEKIPMADHLSKDAISPVASRLAVSLGLALRD